MRLTRLDGSFRYPRAVAKDGTVYFKSQARWWRHDRWKPIPNGVTGGSRVLPEAERAA